MKAIMQIFSIVLTVLLPEFLFAEEPVLKWKYEEYTEDGYFMDEFRISETNPVVAPDGTVYTSNGDECFFAFNADGTLQWRYERTRDAGSTAALAPDGTLYFGDAGRKVYALDDSGQLKWQYETGLHVHEAPAISPDGTVYVGSQDGFLYAFNPDGTVKWKHLCGDGTATFEDYYGNIESSPAVGPDGTIYVSSKDSNLYALTPYGTLKWKFKARHFMSKGSPAIGADGTIYFTCRGHRLYALNPDGSLKWEYEAGDPGLSSPVIAADGTVYIGSWAQDNHIHALNPDGSVKWKYETGEGFNSSGAIGSDGTVYYGCRDGYMYALNPDGTLKWKYYVGNAIVSSPALTPDGTLYFSAGLLYALQTDSNGYQEGSPWPCYMHNNTRCFTTEIPVLDDLHKVSGVVALPDSTPLVEVEVAIGGLTTETDHYGRFSFLLPDGDYTVDIHVNSTKVPDSIDFSIDGGDDVIDLHEKNTLYTLTGRLVSYGEPLSGIPVSVKSETAVTGKDGSFSFKLVEGEYDIVYDVGDKRFPDTQSARVNGSDVTVEDFNVYAVEWAYEADDELRNPVIAEDGTIYVIEEHWREATLLRLAGTGEISGSFYMIGALHEPIDWNASPHISPDGSLYVTLVKSVAALNNELNVLWEFSTDHYGSIRTLSFAQDGTVYLGTLGTVYALNTDGTTKWKTKLKDSTASYKSFAISSDGTLYISTATDSSLVAVNPQGEIKWQYHFDDITGDGPVIGLDGSIYIGSGDGYASAFNPDGTIKWRYMCDSAIKENPSVGPDENIFYVSMNNTVYKFSPDGSLLWTYQSGMAENGNLSTPLVFNGARELFLHDFNGTIICLSEDGRELWRYSFENSDRVTFAQGQGDEVFIALRIVEDPRNPEYSGRLIKTRIGDSVAVSVNEPEFAETLNPETLSINASSHPNPFNPSTTISYTLHKQSRVTVDVFTVTGQKIARLRNEQLPPGKQRMTWNADGFPAGLYFYRIQAGNAVSTGKMILVK